MMRSITRIRVAAPVIGMAGCIGLWIADPAIAQAPGSVKVPTLLKYPLLRWTLRSRSFPATGFWATSPKSLWIDGIMYG
jgi:hypothetical protein